VKYSILCALLLYMSAVVCSNALASIRFKTISLESGLPQVSVNSITKDKRGFIWIGTQDGLARFDGSSFKVFRSNYDNNFSLSDSYVQALEATSDGKIWVRLMRT
jgi:ligand-binding sensor domain-containing protein